MILIDNGKLFSAIENLIGDSGRNDANDVSNDGIKSFS